MKSLKWACALALLVAAVLGVFSVAAYRPVAAGALAAGPPAQQVILSSLGGLPVSGKLTRQAGPWEPVKGMLSARDTAACAGVDSTWSDDSRRPTVYVDLVVARCSSLEVARDLQATLVKATEKSLGAVSLPPAVPYAFQGQGSPVVEWPTGQVQEVLYRRGVYYVDATAYVASSRGGDASGLVRRVALAQYQRLTGAPGPGAQSFAALTGSSIVAAATTFTLLALAVWLLIGYVRRKLRQPRSRAPGSVRGLGEATVDVTRAARRAKWASRGAVLAWAVAGVAAGETASHTSALAAYLVVTLSIGWIAVKVTGRAARPLRPAGRPRPARAEAGWLLLCGAAAAAAMLTLTQVGGLLSPSLAITGGRVDPSAVTDEPLWRWLPSLPLHLVAGDFCAVAALLLLAAVACHRRALRAAYPERAAASGAGTLLTAAPEQLRLRTAAAGRPTLPERLSLRQFDDFHVVVARLLGAFPRAGLGPGIIPVNAAPPGSYPHGEPELLMLGPRQRADGLLLVFPPIPGHEVHARWIIFRQRNAAFLPPGLPDEVIGRHADRMLAARWSPDGGWRCWHADEKSEWSYALALRQSAGPQAAPGTLGYRPAAPATGYDAGPGIPGFALAGRAPHVRSLAGDGPPADDGERRLPGVPRFLRSRKWALALGGAALAAILALNVIASLVTAPGPFDVNVAAAEYLLPPGAVGNGWKPAAVSTTPSSALENLERNGTRCAQRARDWTAEPKLTLATRLTVCSGPGVLADAQTAIEDYAREERLLTGTGGLPYAIEADGPATTDSEHFRQREVLFRAGPVLAAVTLVYPGGGPRLTPAQVRLLEDTARAQLAELPYQPGPGYSPPAADSLSAQVPQLIFLALFWVIAGFSGWSWWVRRRHMARGEGPPPPSTPRVLAIQVTGRARRAAGLARGRFAAQLAGGYCALVSIITPSPARYWYLVVAAVLLAGAPLLRSRELRRPWSARRRSGVLTGRRTARALLLAGGSAAAAAAAAGFALCGLFALVIRSSGTVLPSGRLDRSLLAPGSFFRMLTLEPLKVLTVDFFALAIVAAILVPVLYTAARRVAALTADEVTRGGTPAGEQPRRGEILYLRNFTDDDIRMPTSRLSRNSIVERIAVYRLERFEEVIVRHLGNVGPVVAVSPPGTRKPPIGAARMNLDNATWRKSIQQYIADARLIVVGAAPEGRTEGLAFELAEIARAGALSKTLLVLPPLRSQTVRERWAVFGTMAPDFDLPPELTAGADHQLVLVNSGTGGPPGTARWHTWHSRRRTEWAYAVALRAASRSLLGKDL